MTKVNSPKITLTPRQRSALLRIARRKSNPHRLVTRAKIIVELDSGTSHSQIARQLGLDRSTVLYWRDRWLEEAATLSLFEAEEAPDKALTALIEEALSDKPRPGTPPILPPSRLARLWLWPARIPLIATDP